MSGANRQINFDIAFYLGPDAAHGKFDNQVLL